MDNADLNRTKKSPRDEGARDAFYKRLSAQPNRSRRTASVPMHATQVKKEGERLHASSSVALLTADGSLDVKASRTSEQVKQEIAAHAKRGGSQHVRFPPPTILANDE